jgi:hypothetical protein
MNGSNGIQPVVELATNNNGYAYPVYPMMYGNGGFGGNNGFLGGEGIWAFLLFAMIFGNGNWGGNNGGFFGGGRGFDDGYAWLSNGQKEIMQNTNNGFDTLHLSNQVEGVRDGINSLSNQLCNCCADMNQTVSNGFYNAEISANNRQMADMQQNFNNQIQTLNSFNQVSSQLAQCCCDNRLATCQTQNIVQNEGNQTRFADANNTRDIIDSQTRGTQAILDKLCQLELDNVKLQVDAKNDRIAELQREIQMKDLQASQVAQNAFIANGFANEVDQLYNRLANCPVPSTPVYGRTPIFTCPNNNGCGCSGNYI